MSETQQAKILSGKVVRDRTTDALIGRIKSFSSVPHLVILQVGHLPESNAYIRSKKMLGEKLGCKVTHEVFETNVSVETLETKIEELNGDNGVHGIILQLPMPPSIDVYRAIEAIDPSKDVDGLTGKNVAKLWEGKVDGFIPATARGIISLDD